MKSSIKERRRRVGTAVLAATAVLFLLVPPAVAQDVGVAGFAVQPSGPDGPGKRDYFTYSLKPGQGLQDTVGVSNFFDQPVDFKIYATDAFNTPGDAKFALLAEADKPVDVGSWIRLPVTDYVIQPGQRADIPFSIVVPPDATPGDHAGAVVAQPILPLQTADQGQGLNVQRRIGSRVYIGVDGPRTPALSIEKLSVDHESSFFSFGRGATTVSYEVKNVGNTRLKPTTFVDVTGPVGLHAADQFPREIPELLPGGTYQVDQQIEGVKPLGPLTVELTARTVGQDAVSVTRETSFWAIPWFAIILMALAVFVAWRFIRRRRGQRASGPPAKPPPKRSPQPSTRPREPAAL